MMKFIPLLLLLGVMLNSCTSTTSKDKKLEAHKVYYQDLYDYNTEHDDTLLIGLSGVGKETYVYNDGTSEYSLIFFVESYDFEEEKPVHKRLSLNKEELSRLDCFLDSCLHGKKSDEGIWTIKINDDIYFDYECSNIGIGFDPEYMIESRITPQKLKEIIEGADKENNIQGKNQRNCKH